MPLFPNPPGTIIPSYCFNFSLTSSLFIFSLSTRSIFVFTPFAYPACFTLSITEIYESSSFVYFPTIAICAVCSFTFFIFFDFVLFTSTSLRKLILKFFASLFFEILNYYDILKNMFFIVVVLSLYLVKPLGIWEHSFFPEEGFGEGFGDVPKIPIFYFWYN